MVRSSAISSVGQAGADELVKTSIDSGINFFDTADNYTEGESERVAPQRGSLSFHRERVIRTAAWGFLEDDEPREYRKRRDHQRLIIVDVCDDVRLLRDVASRVARRPRSHRYLELLRRL